MFWLDENSALTNAPSYHIKLSSTAKPSASIMEVCLFGRQLQQCNAIKIEKRGLRPRVIFIVLQHRRAGGIISCTEGVISLHSSFGTAEKLEYSRVAPFKEPY